MIRRKGFWQPPERCLRNNSTARRMWKFYQKHGGWWQFTWPGFAMHDAVQRSTQ